MGFLKFKEQSIRKKFEKQLQTALQNHTTSAKQVQKVGILAFDELSSVIDITRLLEEGLENAKHFHLFSYRPYDKNAPKSYKHFSEKDINRRGEFTDPSIQQFLETPFDILIGFYNHSNLYLEMATLQSKAMFKIGFAGVNDQLFDLVISENPLKTESFISEIVKYLTLLKKI
ncbi:hypothetical protein GCM10011416_18450 [Polaribacter pacificus]|uniref:Uncharacterized protein n=1 Tax=Polaribacter pacificus TaxID=1775173 RepID=A0A917I1I6_9FLAO|nr:hypothetical protein [Polaribacter pacificus]GGH00299.1 hypothetical protein GCM10011416_18450 [Polaribacter pacificus]